MPDSRRRAAFSAARSWAAAAFADAVFADAWAADGSMRVAEGDAGCKTTNLGTGLT